MRLITEKKGEERVFMFYPMPRSWRGSPSGALEDVWEKSCLALPPQIKASA